MKKQFFIILIILFFILSCSKNKELDPTNEKALFEIYSATEIYSGDKAIEVVKKYGLDKKENLTKYYEALRTLSTNEEKWNAFLKKVDELKQRQPEN